MRPPVLIASASASDSLSNGAATARYASSSGVNVGAAELKCVVGGVLGSDVAVAGVDGSPEAADFGAVLLEHEARRAKTVLAKTAKIMRIRRKYAPRRAGRHAELAEGRPRSRFGASSAR
jgi:hypothetical protein